MGSRILMGFRLGLNNWLCYPCALPNNKPKIMEFNKDYRREEVMRNTRPG